VCSVFYATSVSFYLLVFFCVYWSFQSDCVEMCKSTEREEKKIWSSVAFTRTVHGSQLSRSTNGYMRLHLEEQEVLTIQIDGHIRQGYIKLVTEPVMLDLISRTHGQVYCKRTKGDVSKVNIM
jgi:riboflavin synthase alpha subunit